MGWSTANPTMLITYNKTINLPNSMLWFLFWSNWPQRITQFIRFFEDGTKRKQRNLSLFSYYQNINHTTNQYVALLYYVAATRYYDQPSSFSLLLFSFKSNQTASSFVYIKVPSCGPHYSLKSNSISNTQQLQFKLT